MALAELEFIDRREVVHFLGPPGTEEPLSLALGVQAVKAGRSVYFTPLSDLVSTLAKAEREGASVRRSGSFAASRCLSSTKSTTCQSALGALARAQRSRSLIIELQTWLREQRARFSKNSDTTSDLHIWRGSRAL